VAFNNLFKICARRPRPYVYSSEVLNRLPAGGYSFPSGHTQGYFVTATTCMCEIHEKNKKKSVKISALAILSILGVLVMLSRIYWGQHYLTDVIAGMVFGICIPFGLDWFFRILPKKIKSWFTVDRLYAILGIVAFVAFVGLLILELTIGFYSRKAYKFVAVFLALAIGYFVDKKFIGYKCNQGFVVGVIKFLITITILAVLYYLITLIIPISGYIYFVVYLFLGLICTIILPLLFKKIFKRNYNEKCVSE
jgi:undecaprenyl-diphosphatase